MKALLIAACLVLAGCTTSAVTLRNATTGEIATCGPYYVDSAFSNAQAMRETRCLDDFQRQGFVRVSD